MLGVTWFRWVMVVMSTRLADHHHFDSLWVAFFVSWVWILGIGLHAGWCLWVAQCIGEGGWHMWVAWHQCTSGVVAPPFPAPYVFWSFPLLSLDGLLFSQDGCYPTKNSKWMSFYIDIKYCSMQNSKVAGNIIAFTCRNFVCDLGCLIFVGLDHKGRWRPKILQ